MSKKTTKKTDTFHINEKGKLIYNGPMWPSYVDGFVNGFSHNFEEPLNAKWDDDLSEGLNLNNN